MNIKNLQNIRKMSPGYETKLSRSLTSPKRNGFGHPHLSSKVVPIIGKDGGGGGDVDLDDVGGDITSARSTDIGAEEVLVSVLVRPMTNRAI